jgi:type III pantothenate kinase
MSVLLIDVGNTRLKWLLMEEHGRRRGAVEHRGDAWDGMLDDLRDQMDPPAAVALASVVGDSVEQALGQWVAAHWPHALWYVARVQREACGIVNAYRDPGQLGVDRWLAMIGARAVVGLPVCVVDCGSAVTVDVVDAEGRHRGGVIFPGLRLLRSSLRTGTRLSSAGSPGEEFPPRDTATAIAEGTLRGLAGSIERLADELAAAAGPGMKRVLTGGDAARLLPMLGAGFSCEDDLVLEGLELQMRECA